MPDMFQFLALRYTLWVKKDCATFIFAVTLANTSVNMNHYNNAVLLSDAKFKQNMTMKVQKVDKVKTIVKFKDYVRSVLPSHEHKL